MNEGDRVFIYDYSSDLFIFDGEVLKVEGDKVLVMVKTCCGCIVDTFDIDKLHLHKKAM